MSSIRIKAEQYQLVGEETGEGFSIELSPYDMPLEVGGKFDEASKIFHVTFKYLDQEEDNLKEIGRGLKMKVGKHSGKILGFEIDVDKNDIKQIGLTVEEVDRAIDAEIPRLSKYNEKANYKVIKSVLDANQMSIFAPLATANG